MKVQQLLYYLALLFLHISLWSAHPVLALTEQQQKMLDQLDQLDQLDALDSQEFREHEETAKNCIHTRDFACAERSISEASRVISNTSDKTALEQLRQSLAAERALAQEEQRRRREAEERERERERQRLARERAEEESRERAALFRGILTTAATTWQEADMRDRAQRAEMEAGLKAAQERGEAEWRRKQAEAAEAEAQRNYERQRQANLAQQSQQAQMAAQTKAQQEQAARQRAAQEAAAEKLAAARKERIAQQQSEAEANARYQMRQFAASSPTSPSIPIASAGLPSTGGGLTVPNSGTSILASPPSGSMSTLGLGPAPEKISSPGRGRLSGGPQTLGRCKATSTTVEYDLSTNVGDPWYVVKLGWSGEPNCKYPFGTIVWLKLQKGTAYGWVAGYSLNGAEANAGMRGSLIDKKWSELVCAHENNQASGCMDAKSAKILWATGQVTDFMISWPLK